MIGSYNYHLVALSLLIAVCAADAALELAGRTTAARGRVRMAWLVGGAARDEPGHLVDALHRNARFCLAGTRALGLAHRLVVSAGRHFRLCRGGAYFHVN
jgi:hypothetical protein